MNIFKTLVLCFMVLFSVSSFADITADDLNEFNNLSETQKAEVVKQIAQFKETSSVGSGVTADVVKGKMQEWGEIGAGIGMMLISTAKELGVAANEFAQTPLGQLAIVVGLLYMFGDQAVLFLAWVVCWFVFLPIVYFSYRRHAFQKIVEITTTDKVVLWMFPVKNKKVTLEDRRLSDDAAWAHLLIGGLFFVSGVIALANL